MDVKSAKIARVKNKAHPLFSSLMEIQTIFLGLIVLILVFYLGFSLSKNAPAPPAPPPVPKTTVIRESVGPEWDYGYARYHPLYRLGRRWRW